MTKHPPRSVSVSLGGVVFYCTTSTQLEGGLHLAVLTALTRQCTLHRSVLCTTPVDPRRARQLIRRWAKQLPLARLA